MYRCRFCKTQGLGPAPRFLLRGYLNALQMAWQLGKTSATPGELWWYQEALADPNFGWPLEPLVVAGVLRIKLTANGLKK